MSETIKPRGPAEFEQTLGHASQAVASFEEEQASPIRRLQHFLHAYPTSIPIIVLALCYVVFAVLVGQRFSSSYNFGLVVQQVTVIAILGVAQTLVIMTAGIDLSVGAIMVLCHVVMGKLVVDAGYPVPVAFGAGLLVGLACGLFNGLLITKLRLPPFIATLGTWNIFASLNLWYSASQTIRPTDLDTQAPFLKLMGLKISRFFEAIGLPIDFTGLDIFTAGAILMTLVAVVGWYIINRTAFGRHVLAVGDDPEAARLAGIQTDRTLLMVYALAGLICAIAGWALIGRVGAVSPNSGQTNNLDSIVAVVIGGTSLFGGRGSIFGTLVGALIVGLLSSGIKIMGLDGHWQLFAVGWLIAIAVALDQWIRKVSA